LLPSTPEEILKNDLKRKQRERENHLRVTHKYSEGVISKPNKTPQLQRTKTTGKEGLVMMARKGDLKELSEPNAMFFVLLYKENFLSTNDLSSTLPSVVFNVLQEYEDVFPDEVPPGLPPKRGIEHQIDLVPSASLPNQVAYRTNLEETKRNLATSERIDEERVCARKSFTSCCSYSFSSQERWFMENVC